MRKPILALMAALAMTRLATAGVATIQSKADWDTGSKTSLETNTFGVPAIAGSVCCTVLTNWGVLADSFENTIASAANYVTGSATSGLVLRPGYLNQGPAEGGYFVSVSPNSQYYLSNYYSLTQTAFSFSLYFLDVTSTTGTYDFYMGFINKTNGADWSLRARTSLGIWYWDEAGVYWGPATINPNAWPIHQNVWDHLRVRMGSDGVVEYYINGQLYQQVNGPVTPYRFYFASNIPATEPMPCVDFLTFSTWPNRDTSLRLRTPNPGFRYDIQPALSSLTVSAVALSGVTVTALDIKRDAPFLTANLYNPDNVWLGSVSTTGRTDAFIGNYLDIHMSYSPTGSWEKVFTFSSPLSACASVDWICPPSQSLNTFVSVQASVSLDGAAFGPYQSLSGSGVEVPGSKGALALKVKVILNTNDGTQTPQISSLALRYPDPAQPSPVASVAQPDSPFTAWCVPNPLVADGSGTAFIYVKADGQQTLHIYDTGRREVRTLTTVGVNGLASFPWDGRDSTGQALPAGVYLGMAGNSGPRVKLALLRARRQP